MATHCEHCGAELTPDDMRDLRVCIRCYHDILDRTNKRGRYAEHRHQQ